MYYGHAYNELRTFIISAGNSDFFNVELSQISFPNSKVITTYDIVSIHNISI